MRIARGISIANISKPISTAVVYDADALAYFTANTAITSSADKTAINNFYLGLKSDGIYTKIKAMYLPIWGSAATSKWNLINPVDTNGAFRLTFTTGWTFSSGGMTPTNAYADSKLTGTASLTANNSHVSFYSRTNSDIIGMDFGNTTNTFGSITRSGNTLISDFLGNGSPFTASPDRINITNTNSLGHYIFSSTSTNIKIYKNSSLFGSKGSATASNFPSNSILFSYGYTSATARYSNRQLSFASIGNGLTDTEAANLSNRVNTLMTYFGINTY